MAPVPATRHSSFAHSTLHRFRQPRKTSPLRIEINYVLRGIWGIVTSSLSIKPNTYLSVCITNSKTDLETFPADLTLVKTIPQPWTIYTTTIHSIVHTTQLIHIHTHTHIQEVNEMRRRWNAPHICITKWRFYFICPYCSVLYSNYNVFVRAAALVYIIDN